MSAITENPESTRLSAPFTVALIVNFVWINAPEVFRYFAFVMPMMREAFPMCQTLRR